MSLLISAKELQNLMESEFPPLIMDTTTGANAHAGFLAAHLPQAWFFDITAFADPRQLPASLPAMHPSQKIVFYDNSSVPSACRAYWLFRLWGFPHKQLHILSGGLPGWRNSDFPLVSGESPMTMSSPLANFQPALFRTADQVKSALGTSTQILDMRHPVQFAQAHIPGSICFPFFACLDSQGCFLPQGQIARRLSDIGLNLQSPIITTCGSGVTATVMNVILDAMGHQNHALYNGSWGEWSRLGYPVESCL